MKNFIHHRGTEGTENLGLYIFLATDTSACVLDYGGTDTDTHRHR